MKIVELRAENVKRLSAVQITPEGSVVVVGGKNGAGKSSVLDSIVYALNGAGSLPGKPVRKGEENAEIEITIDSEPPMVVRRRIRDDGKTDLEIRQVDGDGKPTAKLAKPQDVLDKLCGTIAFDPLAFTRLKRQEQADVLRQLVGVNVDDLDALEKRLFEERTNVNRDAKRLDSQLAGMPLHQDSPETEVAAGDVLAEIEAVRKYNAEFDNKLALIAAMERDAERLIEAIATYDQQRKSIRQQLERVEADMEACRQDEYSTRERIAVARSGIEGSAKTDPAPYVAKLESIEATNAAVRANAARAVIVEQAAAAMEQADDLTRQIEDCRDERMSRLAAAQWPVDGLAFGDSGVTFNGLPFDQCSSAEQLRISMAIGAAQHPKLRVQLIKDGSLLDEDSLAAIADLAAQYDSQVWIERVGRGDECSVIIEDGSVAASSKSPKQKALIA